MISIGKLFAGRKCHYKVARKQPMHAGKKYINTYTRMHRALRKNMAHNWKLVGRNIPQAIWISISKTLGVNVLASVWAFAG